MSLPRTVKIVSDGTGHNTHVYDAKTGEEIRGVTACDISINPHGVVDVRLQLIATPLEITGQPSFVFNAMQKKAAKMIQRHIQDLDDIFAYRIDHYGHPHFVFEECSLSGLIGALIRAVRKARRTGEAEIAKITKQADKNNERLTQLLRGAGEREKQLIAIAGAGAIIKENRKLAIALGLAEPE